LRSTFSLRKKYLISEAFFRLVSDKFEPASPRSLAHNSFFVFPRLLRARTAKLSMSNTRWFLYDTPQRRGPEPYARAGGSPLPHDEDLKTSRSVLITVSFPCPLNWAPSYAFYVISLSRDNAPPKRGLFISSKPFHGRIQPQFQHAHATKTRGNNDLT
jgi:hypothetical protein